MKKYGNKLKIELGTLALLTNLAFAIPILAAMGRKQEEFSWNIT